MSSRQYAMSVGSLGMGSLFTCRFDLGKLYAEMWWFNKTDYMDIMSKMNPGEEEHLRVWGEKRSGWETEEKQGMRVTMRARERETGREGEEEALEERGRGA